MSRYVLITPDLTKSSPHRVGEVVQYGRLKFRVRGNRKNKWNVIRYRGNRVTGCGGGMQPVTLESCNRAGTVGSLIPKDCEVRRSRRHARTVHVLRAGLLSRDRVAPAEEPQRANTTSTITRREMRGNEGHRANVQGVSSKGGHCRCLSSALALTHFYSSRGAPE